MKGVAACLSRHERIAALEEPHRYCEDVTMRPKLRSWVNSRLPSLLIGWGLGYWVTSVLFLLHAAWLRTQWNDAPTPLTYLGHVLTPIFTLADMFVIADTNILGTRAENIYQTSRGHIHRQASDRVLGHGGSPPGCFLFVDNGEYYRRARYKFGMVLAFLILRVKERQEEIDGDCTR